MSLTQNISQIHSRYSPRSHSGTCSGMDCGNRCRQESIRTTPNSRWLAEPKPRPLLGASRCARALLSLCSSCSAELAGGGQVHSVKHANARANAGALPKM